MGRCQLGGRCLSGVGCQDWAAREPDQARGSTEQGYGPKAPAQCRPGAPLSGNVGVRVVGHAGHLRGLEGQRGARSQVPTALGDVLGIAAPVCNRPRGRSGRLKWQCSSTARPEVDKAPQKCCLGSCCPTGRPKGQLAPGTAPRPPLCGFPPPSARRATRAVARRAASRGARCRREAGCSNAVTGVPAGRRYA